MKKIIKNRCFLIIGIVIILIGVFFPFASYANHNSVTIYSDTGHVISHCKRDCFHNPRARYHNHHNHHYHNHNHGRVRGYIYGKRYKHFHRHKHGHNHNHNHNGHFHHHNHKYMYHDDYKPNYQFWFHFDLN